MQAEERFLLPLALGLAALLPLSAFVTRPSIVGERLKAILEVVSKDLVRVQRSRQREAHGE